VAAAIAWKWSWLICLLFAVLHVAFSWVLVQHSARSLWRYSAQTRLMYMPIQEGKIPAMGDKQLLRFLERRSLKRRVGEDLPLPPGESAQLAIDLEIRQENKPSNLLTLTARSSSREAAVRKVNAYADVLTDEYTTRRLQDLTRWGGAAEIRLASLREELEKTTSELADLKMEAGTETPVETLTSLHSLVAEQRRNALMLDVEVSAAEKTRASLSEGPNAALAAAIVSRMSDLRKIKASMESLDGEISELRQMYTDLNPKVRGKLEDRAELEKKYRAIVEECGGEDPGEGGIEQAERAQTTLLDAISRLDALKEARAELEETISRNEERAAQLAAVAPRVTILSARKNELEHTLKEIAEQIGSVNSLQEDAARDLRQVERATDASENSPVRTENFVLAAVGAGVCAGGFAFLAVVLGLWAGTVRGAREMSWLGDVKVLGSLPGRLTLDRQLHKDAMEVVANHFMAAEESKGVVLVCRLRGARPQPRFEEALEWSLTMSGVVPFVLTVVKEGSDDVPDEGTDTMLNTVRKGPEGWFPVVNRYSLAPTELQMLKADLATLKGECDCILVKMHDGLRRGGDFTAQLLGACDSALLMVGANRTRRPELSYARRLAKEAGKKMMGLVTGEKGRVVRRELEESRW